MVAVVRAYHVEVERGASKRWWLIDVAEIAGAHSQARRLDQVEEVARDLIAAMEDDAPTAFEVDITVRLPEEVQRQLDLSAANFEQASQLQAEAARLIRVAAAWLHRDEGLPLRDIGRILGVSFQRAKQLIDEAQSDRAARARTRHNAGLSTRTATAGRAPAIEARPRVDPAGS